ncbi:MAG: ribosome maturation factor RimP [Spirosomataceae bacterium]
MNTKAKIEEILSQLPTEDNNFYVVDILVSASKIKTKVSVLIDTDSGISIDQCAEVSRRLGEQLEELNLFENAYTLEVSSPGVDQPLKLNRQYVKNIGRNVRVLLKDGTEKTGKLEAVSDTHLTLGLSTKTNKKAAVPAQPLVLAFDTIHKTQVLISFK